MCLLQFTQWCQVVVHILLRAGSMYCTPGSLQVLTEQWPVWKKSSKIGKTSSGKSIQQHYPFLRYSVWTIIQYWLIRQYKARLLMCLASGSLVDAHPFVKGGERVEVSNYGYMHAASSHSACTSNALVGQTLSRDIKVQVTLSSEFSREVVYIAGCPYH